MGFLILRGLHKPGGLQERVSSLMRANHWLGYLPFED